MITVPATEVTSRWAGDTVPAPSDNRLITLIGDVEALIDREYPDVATHVADGKLTQRGVYIAVASIVQRVWYANPDRVRQWSNGVGPFQQSESLDPAEKAALRVEADEAIWLVPKDLRKAVGGAVLNLDPQRNRFDPDIRWMYDSWIQNGTSW